MNRMIRCQACMGTVSMGTVSVTTALAVLPTYRFYLCNFSAPCAHLLEIFGPLE